jgi:ABC-type amino acid transport substrate-binding protein
MPSYLPLVFVLFAAGADVPARAEDMIIVDAPKSETDFRNADAHELLQLILEKTKGRFGTYVLKTAEWPMTQDRLLLEMKKGERVNLTCQVSRLEWEKELLPVYIPVDKGVSSYHLFLILKKNRKKFEDLKNLEELKKLQLGVSRDWSAKKIYSESGFNLTLGNNYEGLFQMLLTGRSDYFPRNLNEVYGEKEAHQKTEPQVVVDTSNAIYYPSLRYFFVSPKFPELHRRLEYGLKLAIEDGSYEKVFLKYTEDDLKKAQLCKRKIFRIPGHGGLKPPPLTDKKIWFDPKEYPKLKCLEK